MRRQALLGGGVRGILDVEFRNLVTVLLLRVATRFQRVRNRTAGRPHQPFARNVRVLTRGNIRALSRGEILAKRRASRIGVIGFCGNRYTPGYHLRLSMVARWLLLRTASASLTLIPWFVLLAILGLNAMRRAPVESNHRIEIAAGFLLLAIGIAIERPRCVVICGAGLERCASPRTRKGASSTGAIRNSWRV